MDQTIVETLFEYVPGYWDMSRRSSNIISVPLRPETDLYKKVQKTLVSTNKPIKSIEINQNILDYGQYLIRGELLMRLNPGSTFYKVRRFVKIREDQLDLALRYNLDYRRFGRNSDFIFEKTIHHIDHGEIVLVVQLLSRSPTSVNYSNSSEYFIDLIIRF